MELITNPQSYNICFSIASLLLIMVTYLIHASEDKVYNKQGHIFGALILDAFMLNLMGFVHNIYLYSDVAKTIIGYEGNTYVVIAEKMFAHLLPYLSITYVMSLFQLNLDRLWKKAVMIFPVFYAIAVFVIGFFTNFYFYFTEEGNLKYIYPQGVEFYSNQVRGKKICRRADRCPEDQMLGKRSGSSPALRRQQTKGSLWKMDRLRQ